MKTSILLTAMALGAANVVAFPSRMFDTPLSPAQKRAAAAHTAQLEKTAKEKRVGTPVAPGFSASQQYVSNTGAHAYVAPKSTDLRGPCPGLNAMANHGYIPHNGLATITQFTQGTYEVFGMGVDLGAFLAIYGAVFDGDLTSWSIGGPPPASLLSLGGLLGTPQGITNSHNKYETDVSPTRGDLYQYGDDYKLVMSQFEDMYSLTLGPNGYDLTTLTPFRAKRFQQSIDNNPYFFNGPFSGVGVQPAAYTFIYRFMANKSSEYPEGYLNGDVLKSFFGVTGQPGSFVWTPGTEKIPNAWYKRAIGDEYTIPYYVVDLVAAALEFPQFLSIGGNTGTVDSFTGIDISDLTGGVYEASTLLEGDNLACFIFQFAQQASPDLLSGLFSIIGPALSQIDSEIGNVLSTLTCPELKSIDTSQLSQFPGSKGVV